MFGWRHSFDASFDHARRFYLTLIACMAIAIAIGFAGVKPITLLFFSGIAGGIATPFTIVLMLLIGRNRKVMHQMRISGWLAAAGWCVAVVVAGAASIYIVQTVTGKS
jgi:Mn2+/Fe2+ NRAMP family transporter